MLIFVFGMWLNATQIVELKDQTNWQGEKVEGCTIYLSYSFDSYGIAQKKNINKGCDEVAKIINAEIAKENNHERR